MAATNKGKKSVKKGLRHRENLRRTYASGIDSPTSSLRSSGSGTVRRRQSKDREKKRRRGKKIHLRNVTGGYRPPGGRRSTGHYSRRERQRKGSRLESHYPERAEKTVSWKAKSSSVAPPSKKA